jgi:pimeloyl-ACP methyl ester carboxylesterase
MAVPGMAHNYPKPMGDLAETGRAVIHYDQFGCGLGTHLPDAPIDLWVVEELHNLVAALELTDGFHLLGQSWDGMLAPEHVLTHPDGVLSMTLASHRSAARHRSPEARAHVFPGASHTAHLEAPEEFNRIVGEFLDESERAR